MRIEQAGAGGLLAIVLGFTLTGCPGLPINPSDDPNWDQNP